MTPNPYFSEIGLFEEDPDDALDIGKCFMFVIHTPSRWSLPVQILMVNI